MKNVENVKIEVTVKGVTKLVDAIKVGNTTLVNMTALVVNFYEGDEEQFEVPMAGLPMIKLEEETSTPDGFKDGLEGMPVVAKQYTDIINTPDPIKGVYFIVTALVIKEAKRKDFIAPDTGFTSVRDVTGELTGRKNAVIGVRQWITAQ